MSKLLTEPRLPKVITGPKPRKKLIKRSPEDEKPKYTLLKESDKKHILRFIDLYKENALHARVKFFSNDSNQPYSFTRLVLFEWENGDFEISEFEVKFGISITNRMYSSQKKLRSLIYKKGKFWCLDKTNVRGNSGGKILPMSFSNVYAFIHLAEHGSNVSDSSSTNSKIHEFLKTKFFWFKTIHEHKYAWRLSFNKIVKDELFNFKALNRELFKVPNNIAEIAIGSQADYHSRFRQYGHPAEFLKVWKEIIKVLDNIQNLTSEMLYHEDFIDTCRMARTLGKKVNCSWGVKRMKQEHDEWAKEITHIKLACEKEYQLDVRKHFRLFADFSGYKLLMTNKEMLFEGMTQNHCVGTYLDRVDNGSCAIFHVEGGTLQVVVSNYEVYEDTGERVRFNIFGGTLNAYDLDDNDAEVTNIRKTKKITCLVNAQFRMKHNQSPPDELVKRVNTKLEEFSKSELYQEYLENPNAEKFKVEDQWVMAVNGFQRQRIKAEENLPF